MVASCPPPHESSSHVPRNAGGLGYGWAHSTLMLELRGAFTLVTGAAGGLGPVIARALAAEGCSLVLAALPGDDLTDTIAACRGAGAEVVELRADLAEPGAPAALARDAEAALGGLDLLVNNAGIEKMLAYDLLEPEFVARMVAVNLTAPLLLTRAALPGMLARGKGHIVNLCSMAAVGPPPYGATYSATKAGLLAFTRALRSECRSRNVSASAICPGFVADGGMYARMVAQGGARSPMLVGETTTSEVARAVVRAVRDDLPIIMVAPGPLRVMRALDALAPSLGDWLMPALGVTSVMKEWSAHNAGEASMPAPVTVEDGA